MNTEERVRKTMVRLSSSQARDALPHSKLLEGRDGRQDGSPTMDSPLPFTALQLALNPSGTVCHDYDACIKDCSLCLGYKIHNMEEKKFKLEGYMLRKKNGERLNRDQRVMFLFDIFCKEYSWFCCHGHNVEVCQDAVAGYDKVVHSITFGKQLQTTLDALTQDLLGAQKTSAQCEQMQRAEAEQRRLSMMLQVQYVLRSLQSDDVRKNFCNSQEYANVLSTNDMKNLLDLASLLERKCDESMSLEDQMKGASFVYLDLLKGKDEPVAGSTYKHLKEKLLRLVHCGFFDHISTPVKVAQQNSDDQNLGSSFRPCSRPARTNLNSNEVPSRKFLNRHKLRETDHTVHSCKEEEDMLSPNWKADFMALKQQEPPDCWEMDFSDAPLSSPSVLQKPWKGFIPKPPVSMKRPTVDPKQDGGIVLPDDIFGFPCSLAKDPALRRQQVDDLMGQISGSFSFIQDSLLDVEASPTDGWSRRLCLSSDCSPLALGEQKETPPDILPQTLHSTPLHVRLVSDNGESTLGNGDLTLNSSDLEQLDIPYTGKLCNGEMTTPVSAQTCLPSRRSLNVTTSAPFISTHSVFCGESPITVSSEQKPESVFLGSMCLSYSTASTLSYSTASTQTPPEFSLPQDDLQMESAYLSESEVSATSQVYSSPTPSSALQSQSSFNQPYYHRSTFGGMARGGRGLPHSYRSPGASRGGYEAHRLNSRAPGGGFLAQTHREPGSPLYSSQENGYQLNHKQAGGTAAQRNGSAVAAVWSDSSQMSSPDRDGTFILDSGHGDSLSISPMEMPVSHPNAHALLPVHVYPVSPQVHVAFSAARTSNFAPGTLDHPISFDLLHSNLGDVFDASTGRFSCPATGTYVFIFHILKLAVNVPLYINLMRNEEVIVSAYANDGAPDHETASNHALLQLYHGDQVWLRLHRGAIYGSSWKYSTFSGFLLYPD